MKRNHQLLAALALLTALTLSGCTAPSGPDPVQSPAPEAVSSPTTAPSPSAVPETEAPGHTYSDEEVAQAKAAAEAEFANLTGCTLVSMDYDPQRSYEAAARYCPDADEAELNNWIVLFATFTTDGNQAVLEPNSTYEDYMYILHREDADAPWIVMDGGY